MDDLNALMAERLREARGKESIASVAFALGISQSALRMYEAGKRRPRDEVKIMLADYYNYPVRYLFFGQ